VFKILGMCRAKARALSLSRDHAIAGNTAKSQVYARRAERGLSGAARQRLAAEKRGVLATTRAARAAPKADAFSLKQESATGKAAFKVADLGRGRTGHLFDMKKGDLPGQSSLLDAGYRPNPKAPAKAQRATLAPAPGRVGQLSPEFELATARGKLATRARTAEKLRGLKGLKDEHSHPELHGKPDTPYIMGTEHIHFDPDRFQYKLGAQGAHGVTDALGDVTEWNPKLAGIVSVWRDPADGKTYVVNGHHRLHLAKRLGVDRVKVQYLDSPDAVHARSEGALMNIAEGRGTALDAAKFFRDRGMTIEGMKAHGVSLKEHTAKQGLAMSHLSDPIFKRVVAGDLSTNRAAIIGAAGLSHDEQGDLMRTLDKGKYRNVTDGTVRNLAGMFKVAGSVKVKEKTLFGDDEHAESLGVHRATLEDKIKRKLTEDHKLFGLVSKSKSAQALAERADASVDTDKAGAVAQEARTLHHFFDHLKQYGGLSRSLNEGAERLHSGHKADEVFREHYKKAREHIKAELEAGGLG